MSLIIAGERSGVGKTTVTLTLLACLCKYKYQVQSFKVGPDYIDPMFHRYVTGKNCRNLDPVLTSEKYIQECFAHHSQGVDFTVVEGVMGLFDGIGHGAWGDKSRKLNQEKLNDCPIFNSQCSISLTQCPVSYASTAHIAKLLNIPVLLVIDCSRLSGSVAAIAHGYATLDPNIEIAGVILNRVGSERHLELLKNSLELLHLPILGVLRRENDITIPDRHLGLVPTEELPELDAIITRLASLGDSCFDWDKLLPLLGSGENLSVSPLGGVTLQASYATGESGIESGELRVGRICRREYPPSKAWGSRYNSNSQNPIQNLKSKIQNPLIQNLKSPVRVAVALDKAFNFYYQDNLDLLQKLGAELVYWSPLEDENLPKKIQGFYFGGGFPEVFIEQLASNINILNAVKEAILEGIPTIAECGGLMYLCEQIIDFEGKSKSMVGVLPATAVMDKHLTLGYRRAIALQDSLLVKAGEKIYGHEFHRSRLISNSQQPLFETYRCDSEEFIGKEGWSLMNLHASYIHMHWGANLEIPQRFLRQCITQNSTVNISPI